MPAPTLDQPLRIVVLTRKSRGDDEGTHADQERVCREHADRDATLNISDVWNEHKISGGKNWRRRKIGLAIEAVKRGEFDGIMHAWEDRISREGLEAAVEIWNAMREAGAVYVACDGVDSRVESDEDIFYIKATIANMQLKAYRKRSNMGRERAVTDWGVHGGDRPPLGYKFSERVDGSTNMKGAPKHGPLVKSADAERVTAAFKRFGATEDWAPWSEIIKLLGVKWLRNAQAIMTNRVYLGVAYSGDVEKPDAHPALTDRVTFDRVQFRLAEQKADYAGRTRAPAAPLALAKVLRCTACGGVLTPDRTKRGGNTYVSWRCKRYTIGLCDGSGSIADTDLLAYAIERAQGWHERVHPVWALGRATDDATRPALEKDLIEAQADVLRLESEIGAELPATSKQKQQVERALAAIREHEAAAGWIARAPEDVAGMIESGDVEQLNEFLRQTVRIVVSKVGRAATKSERAPELRTTVLYLDHGRTAGGENPETFIPVPGAAETAPVAS
jgi:DNA invertase Pin-like site-specific DNA recombinase